MESAKIVLLCVVAAVVYGIMHDQVTARVCVEYFTIGHPPLIDSQSPTLLALAWGIAATWWAGLLMGIPAAIVSRAGSLPKCDAKSVGRPVAVLLAVMGCAALFAGLAGYFSANAGAVWLVEPLRSRVPTTKHPAYLADLWAHLTAYGVGFFGGAIVCGWVLRQRWKSRPALKPEE